MPQLSKRSINAYASPIRKLAPYADAARSRGTEVLHLNIGQPDIHTPAGAVAAVRNWQPDVLAYTPSKGMSTYLNKLPLYYMQHGIDIQPADIVVTNGASEAIWMVLLATTDQEHEVIIPEPFYANYNGFAAMLDVQVHPLTLRINDGFALPATADFEAAITPRTKAIMLCNPSNPTGTLYSQETLLELAELVVRYDLFLIVDEVYREFCYDDLVFFSALNLKGLEQHVVVLDSISKRYSACGARVGAVITRNHQVIANVTKYAELRLSPPSYGQMLATALLDTPAGYFADVKVTYTRRRNLLFKRLSAMAGVRCYRPGGAFYIFAELPIDDGDRFCQWLLESFSYNGQTVMLAPGSGFYFTPGLGRREVRIAYVLAEEKLHQAMDVLEKALEVYPGSVSILV